MNSIKVLKLPNQIPIDLPKELKDDYIQKPGEVKVVFCAYFNLKGAFGRDYTFEAKIVEGGIVVEFENMYNKKREVFVPYEKIADGRTLSNEDLFKFISLKHNKYFGFPEEAMIFHVSIDTALNGKYVSSLRRLLADIYRKRVNE